MKSLQGIIAAVVVGLCCVCCGEKMEKYGDVTGMDGPKAPIALLLYSPKDYIGKQVVIEGVIATECPAGGWIRVEDKDGHSIYVEFHGAAFAPIPQRVGRKVTAKGVVFQSEGAFKEVQILGKGVVVQ